MGISCGVARLGMIVGTTMVDKHIFFEKLLPKITLGIFSFIVSGLVMFFLPERAMEPLRMSNDDEIVVEEDEEEDGHPDEEAAGGDGQAEEIQMQTK